MKNIKDQLEKKLEALNEKVDQAISERELFLDEHMHLFADFKIGERVYNTKTRAIGICTKHYRYNESQNELYDSDFNVDCEIEEPENSSCYDNTSRYGGIHPWILLKDYEKKSDKYIRKLEHRAL